MKKLLAQATAVLLTAAMLVGCGSSTSGNQNNNNQNNATPTPTSSNSSQPSQAAPVQTKPEEIRILLMSSGEKDGNVLRDQLTKAGFDVKLNTQPDYSSFLVVLDSGEYDLAVGGWTTVTGNPDYAVRSIFQTGGDYNRQPIEDPAIDALIDKAATETPEEYVKTYTDLENALVTENAYIIPMYSSLRLMALNKEVVDQPTVRHSKSRSMVWERIEYVDKTQSDSRVLVLTQTMGNLTSLWPVKGNDGSINQLNTNLYIRLVNLTDEDEVLSDGSLSYNFAIGEGNTEYYFVLRDDVNFAKVVDKKSVDTGVRVGGEDVVFTLNVARDKAAAPDHRTYTLHSSMEKIEIITDLEELKGKKESGKTTSVFDALNASKNGMPGQIAELVESKTGVDNKAGKYQVVKITTNKPFPQVLNFLAHQSAGIVCKDQVELINKDVNFAAYDPTKDVIYGDQSTITEGATYNNHLWTSGPYALLFKNDYEIVFEKNYGYMPNTDNAPRIKNITYKVITDNTAAVSAFRSGEIDILPFIPEDQVSILEADSRYYVSKRTSNGVTYSYFNLKNGNKFLDVDLRKAVLYAINQDDFIAVYQGLKNRSYSTLSTLIDTGNVLNQDLNASKEYLAKYQAK